MQGCQVILAYSYAVDCQQIAYWSFDDQMDCRFDSNLAFQSTFMPQKNHARDVPKY